MKKISIFAAVMAIFVGCSDDSGNNPATETAPQMTCIQERPWLYNKEPDHAVGSCKDEYEWCKNFAKQDYERVIMMAYPQIDFDHYFQTRDDNTEYLCDGYHLLIYNHYEEGFCVEMEKIYQMGQDSRKLDEESTKYALQECEPYIKNIGTGMSSGRFSSAP